MPINIDKTALLIASLDELLATDLRSVEFRDFNIMYQIKQDMDIIFSYSYWST